MKVLLIDDELPSLMYLGNSLSKYDVKILGMFQNPLEGIQFIVNVEKPQVVFLDINMPQMDGISAAKEIIQIDDKIRIVFITAFDTHAVKAFQLNAVHYILKPISPAEIEICVKRLKKNLEDTTEKEFKQNNFLKQDSKMDFVNIQNIKIPAWKDERIFLCDPDDISYIYVEDRSVIICTCKGEIYKNKETLSYYEDRLDKSKFFRWHKSYIVNAKWIKEVIPWFNNTYTLRMEGGKENVPVSRNYIKSFKKLFGL